MKKLCLLILLLTCVGCKPNTIPSFVITLEAQSFPFPVHVEVAPNPATENVTSYIYILDGNPPVTFGIAIDPSCSCVKSSPFNINDSNNHTVQVFAVNSLNVQSTGTSIAFNVKSPSKPNASIKGGS